MYYRLCFCFYRSEIVRGILMEDEPKKKYSGYGYHGGGRKPTGRKVIYKTVSISGLPEEIEAMKKLSAQSGKTFSRFIIESILK